MEIVTVKFQEEVLKKIDDSIEKHNFNSRTEFIREAVRDKLSELERDELVKKFMALKGSVKRKTTEAEYRKIREETSRESLAYYQKKFNI